MPKRKSFPSGFGPARYVRVLLSAECIAAADSAANGVTTKGVVIIIERYIMSTPALKRFHDMRPAVLAQHPKLKKFETT